MDIYDYTQNDRNRIDQLILQFNNLVTDLRKLELICLIAHLLGVHCKAEGENFYKFMHQLNEIKELNLTSRCNDIENHIKSITKIIKANEDWMI